MARKRGRIMIPQNKSYDDHTFTALVQLSLDFPKLHEV